MLMINNEPTVACSTVKQPLVGYCLSVSIPELIPGLKLATLKITISRMVLSDGLVTIQYTVDEDLPKRSLMLLNPFIVDRLEFHLKRIHKIRGKIVIFPVW